MSAVNWTLIIHAVIVLAVVIAVTVLGALGTLPAGTVAGVLGVALGFSGSSAAAST